MPVSYVSNISSLKAQTYLNKTTDSLNRSYQRLSSGLRINDASDDPAGLAIADGLRAQSRIATVAIRNANDGLSVAAVADSALNEVGDILQRMAELAEQSGNGVYTNTQRSAMSMEYLALGSEIDRIAKTTTFNNVALLSGSTDLNLQVGWDSGANSRITITAVKGTLDSLGLASSGSSSMTYSIISDTVANSQSAAGNALMAINSAISTLANTRGTLGAAESRLSHAINFLSVARDNYVAAESSIRDVDVAQEVADMVRLQVLQQAETAVIAQANQQPEVAYSLLQ